MSDDFVKRGLPTGMSMFAKITGAIIIAMVVGGLFVGFQMYAAYAEITDAVEDTWERIAARDQSLRSFGVNLTDLENNGVWGTSAEIAIENRDIWFHQATSQGTWTDPDGQVVSFDMDLIKNGDLWRLSGMTLTQ